MAPPVLDAVNQELEGGEWNEVRMIYTLFHLLYIVSFLCIIIYFNSKFNNCVGGFVDTQETQTVDSTLLDWQTASLIFAASAFALFLVAVAYILFHHAKQWRHMENMERRFDRGKEFTLIILKMISAGHLLCK